MYPIPLIFLQAKDKSSKIKASFSFKKSQNIKLLTMVNDFTRPPKTGLEKESPFEETEGLVRRAGWTGRAVRES